MTIKNHQPVLDPSPLRTTRTEKVGLPMYPTPPVPSLTPQVATPEISQPEPLAPHDAVPLLPPILLNPHLQMRSLDSPQVGGSHYHVQGIQPITYIQANKLGYEEGNIVKYITRHHLKDGSGDLKKLAQYLAFILEDQYELHMEVTYSDIPGSD